MPKHVQGPEGRSYSFPDDATNPEILRFFQAREGGTTTQRQATAQAAAAVGHRRNRRSLWERFSDNASDTWNTSFVAESYRAGRLEGAQNAAGLVSVQELNKRDGLLGNPIRSYGRAVGALGQAFQPEATTADALGDVTGEAERRQSFASKNDRKQGDDSFLSYFREGDVLGGLSHGGVALAGTLTAAAADPSSYISAGRSVIARAATQALVAGGADLIAQDAGRDIGLQESIDWGRTALSAAAGGAFSTAGDLAHASAKTIKTRFLGQPEARAVAELEVGDELLAPALTLAEIESTKPRLTATEGITVETPDGVVHDVPAVPRKVTHEDATGSSKATGEAPEGVPTVIPAEAPKGDGASGWQDVDWGKRKSPERAAAAARHLDGLSKWIKPEHVQAFTRLLDEGIPGADEGVHINERWVDWDKMGDPAEILGFTNAMADIFKTVYDKAGDARQGWDATAKIAKQMGYTLSDVIKTHADITGEGGITARAGALRDAALASDKAFADQLNATRAALASGDKSGIPALAEALNRTIVMGAMDAGASSEIARALQYRKRLGKPQFPKNDLQAAMDELSNVMAKGQELGDKELGDILDGLSDAYDKGGSAGLRQRVRQMREMGFYDYVGYYATASLLSAPTTHIRNATGTPIHALFQIGERYVAAGIGAARTSARLGSVERVTFREAVAYSAAFSQAWAEALTLAGQAWKRGAPVADLRSSVLFQEHAVQVPFQFSRQRWEEWKAKPLHLKTWGDGVAVAVFELQRTLGFRASVATDEFYKAFGRRMQVNALAYREAAYRSALVDPGRADRVFNDTLKAMQDQPTDAAFREAETFFAGKAKSAKDKVYDEGSPEEQMALILRSIDHRQMAVDHAQMLTFQNSGPVTDKIDQALRALPLLKHLYVNFVRTPVALLKAGMVDRNVAIRGLVSLGYMQPAN